MRPSLRLRRLSIFEECVEGDATVVPEVHCSCLTTNLGVDGESGATE